MASNGRQKTAEFTADTVEKATEVGLATLGLEPDDVQITVIQPDQNGGSAQAVVSITYDEDRCRRKRDEAELEKYLTLRYSPNGFALKVDPVPEELHWQLLEVTQQFLRKHCVPGFKGLTREKLIQEQSGGYHTIYEPEVIELGEVRASIYLAPNRMAAYFIQYDAGTVLREAFNERLERKTITSGLIEEAIESIFDGSYSVGLPIVIARGQEPCNEQDAPLEYMFNPSKIRISYKGDSSVDFRDVMRLSFAKKDDTLVRRGDRIAGEPGWSVQGEEVPYAVESETELPQGANTYVTEDGHELRAEIDGHIEIHGGLVCVEEVFVVEGDLDYHVGNVHFDGSVIIRGDVMPEFEVKAKGNVEVFGSVDDAVIESEGDITVQYGIVSKGGGCVTAKGDVRAKHAENVAIAARRIYIASSAVNCELTAQEHIEVTSATGTLVGGTARAKDYVCAGVFGSEIGTRTDVAVGDPSEYDAQIEQLKREIGQRARRRMELMHKYELAVKNPAISGRLTARQRELLGQMLAEAVTIDKELPGLRAQLPPLKTERRRLAVAKCHVGGKLYDSTLVRLFTAKRYFTEDLERCSLMFDKDQVRAYPFQSNEVLGEEAMRNPAPSCGAATGGRQPQEAAAP